MKQRTTISREIKHSSLKTKRWALGWISRPWRSKPSELVSTVDGSLWRVALHVTITSDAPSWSAMLFSQGLVIFEIRTQIRSLVSFVLCTALKVSWRRGFDPVSTFLFDLYHYLEQTGAFGLVPEHAPCPSSQVLPCCRVRHQLGSKSVFVRLVFFVFCISLFRHVPLI